MSTTKDADDVPEIIRLLNHLPLDGGDETLIVLKGHLLLEDLMWSYCSSRLQHPHYLQAARMGFAQTVGLARSLLEAGAESWVWNAAIKLNSLRNMLAHKLDPPDVPKVREAFLEIVNRGNQAALGILISPTGKLDPLAVAIMAVFSRMTKVLRPPANIPSSEISKNGVRVAS